MLIVAFLIVGLFVSEQVTANDNFDDCSDSFYTLTGCILENGLDISNIGAPDCTLCMEQSNIQDTNQLSCAELTEHVSGAMGACQPECSLPGCTLELTTMMTCFNVRSSDCELFSPRPSASPSKQPTLRPTASPTHPPTAAPSDVPSDAPSDIPTDLPSGLPTVAASEVPTQIPSSHPTTMAPSDIPTQTPSSHPTTIMPSDTPSAVPSYSGLRKNPSEQASESGPFGPLLDLLLAMGGGEDDP